MAKKGGSDNSGQMAAQQEAQRQQQISSGTDAINNTFDSQFTPDYYSKIASGYEQYADPQLDSQFKSTQKSLAFNLARDGNLDSSTAGDQQASLQQQYQANKLGIANQAQSYANTAQSNVEASRTNLINSLNSTGNASQSANLAADQASALAATPSYSALGDLFSTTTSALATQANAERTAAISGGLYSSPYSTGLFANPGGVKVTA